MGTRMTDLVLTKKYFDSLVEAHHKQNGVWRRSWTGKLLASHRLQAARIQELEELVKGFRFIYGHD